MTQLRFGLGENVAYAERCFPDVTWEAGYEVVATLGDDGHGPQYTIRCSEPMFDRVVRERELSPAPPELAACSAITVHGKRR